MGSRCTRLLQALLAHAWRVMTWGKRWRSLGTCLGTGSGLSDGQSGGSSRSGLDGHDLGDAVAVLLGSFVGWVVFNLKQSRVDRRQIPSSHVLWANKVLMHWVM